MCGKNKVIIAVGVASLVLGVISRIMVKPLPPVGLEAEAMLNFAGVCFLLSIALSLSECKK